MHISDEVIELAKNMRDSGFSYRRIAREIGICCSSTIKKAMLSDEDREKFILKRKEHRYNDRERLNEVARIYRKNNHDKILVWQAEYRKNGKENIKASRDRYQETHKDEIKERVHARRDRTNEGETIIKDQYDAIWEEQDGRCFYCGEKMLRDGDRNSVYYYNIEHIDPFDNGGEHALSNIVYACRGCNSKKGKKLVENWMPEILDKIAKHPRLAYGI